MMSIICLLDLMATILAGPGSVGPIFINGGHYKAVSPHRHSEANVGNGISHYFFFVECYHLHYVT